MKLTEHLRFHKPILFTGLMLSKEFLFLLSDKTY